MGHCATSRKIAVSIPDGVIRIFHWHNPSDSTMALGLTQPLTETSTRNIFLGDKGGRCVELKTLPPSWADCLEIWEPQPLGTLRALPFTFIMVMHGIYWQSEALTLRKSISGPIVTTQTAWSYYNDVKITILHKYWEPTTNTCKDFIFTVLWAYVKCLTSLYHKHMYYTESAYSYFRGIPLQAWTGREGSRRWRLPDFKTVGTWRWEGCQLYAPAAFTPRKHSWYSFLLEAESTPGP
jgi:hypothetical protein